MGGSGFAPEAPPLASPMVFTRREKWGVALLFVGIIAATVLGLAATFFVGQVYGIFIGLGVLCYTLGLRHGVDADHICAIDNTTRKLLQQGKRPYTVGTWFSLGHSTIVMAMLVALVFAERSILSNIPAFRSYGSVIGTAVSGGFLYIIAFINLLIFLEIYAIFKKLRTGSMNQQELEEQLNKRGFMNRYFNPLFKLVNEPWQIYPVGVLFGLGFDTSTEVLLISTTLLVATLSVGFPLWMVLILPFMFTCGMVLVDTSDGIGMRFAYGWAFLKPIRKVYYNLTMTVISVLVAFVIGTIEVLGVVASELHLVGGPYGFWNSMQWLNAGVGPASIDVWGYVGIAIVALFIGCWLIAMLIYRWKGYETKGFADKGSPPLPPNEPPPGTVAQPIE
jgi:nickel/cobalt transporter (NiCoT) family protein